MKLILLAFDETTDGYAVMNDYGRGVVVVDTTYLHATAVVKLIAERIVLAMKRDEHKLAILCSHEAIPNFIGHMIDAKLIHHEDVEIILYTSEGKTSHGYDVEGYLQAGWPYGVLAWDSEAGRDVLVRYLNK